jgi:hypothetical protein
MTNKNFSIKPPKYQNAIFNNSSIVLETPRLEAVTTFCLITVPSSTSMQTKNLLISRVQLLQKRKYHNEQDYFLEYLALNYNNEYQLLNYTMPKDT